MCIKMSFDNGSFIAHSITKHIPLVLLGVKTATFFYRAKMVGLEENGAEKDCCHYYWLRV